MGIQYDFGSPTAIQQITVTTDRPGIQVQIRAGDAAAAGDPDSYPVVGATTTMKTSSTFKINKGTSARYYVIWLTQLTPDGAGQFWGSISEVTFRR